MKTYIDAVLHNAWLLFYLFLFLATTVAERDNAGSELLQDEGGASEHFTSDRQLCTDPCSEKGEAYKWCSTSLPWPLHWGYCSLSPEEDYQGFECMTWHNPTNYGKCLLSYSRKYYYCYRRKNNWGNLFTDNKWGYCSPTRELMISHSSRRVRHRHAIQAQANRIRVLKRIIGEYRENRAFQQKKDPGEGC